MSDDCVNHGDSDNNNKPWAIERATNISFSLLDCNT